MSGQEKPQNTTRLQPSSAFTSTVSLPLPWLFVSFLTREGFATSFVQYYLCFFQVHHASTGWRAAVCKRSFTTVRRHLKASTNPPSGRMLCSYAPAGWCVRSRPEVCKWGSAVRHVIQCVGPVNCVHALFASELFLELFQHASLLLYHLRLLLHCFLQRTNAIKELRTITNRHRQGRVATTRQPHRPGSDLWHSGTHTVKHLSFFCLS